MTEEIGRARAAVERAHARACPLGRWWKLGLGRVIAEKRPAAGFRLHRASYKGDGLKAGDGLRRARWLTAMDTLCRQHGVSELWSADRDFGRFPRLHVSNPLVSALVQ